MDAGTLPRNLQETLAGFDRSGAPLTTSEVADDLDLGRRSTYDRLDRLVEEGYLETKKVGASARVWWRPPSPASGSSASPLVDDVLEGGDTGLFLLDADHEVVWATESIERYFGVDRDLLVGQDKPSALAEHIAPVVADTETFTERVLATYEDGTATEQFECRVTAGEGREERWLEHHSKPVESGEYAGGRLEFYHDITDRKRSAVDRREEREQFESLVEAVEEYAIFVLDPDGRVRTWNAGAERIKGYEAEEIVGEQFSTFYTGADREAGVPEANLEAAAADGSVEDEGWRVRADGSEFWANVTISAITADGELEGFVKVTRDMTERKRAREEHELQRSVSRALAEAGSLEDGLEAVLEEICTWTDWEVGQAWEPTDEGPVERLPVAHGESDASGQFNRESRSFTFEPGEGIPGRAAASGEPVWFDDVSAVSTEEYPRRGLAAEAGLRAGLGVPVPVDGETAVVLEFYMSEARGEQEWLVEVVETVASELGGLVARKQVEDDRDRERALLDRVLETAPVRLAIFDADGSLERANTEARRQLGLEDDGLSDAALSDFDLSDPVTGQVSANRHPLWTTLVEGEPVSDWVVQHEHATEGMRWLSLSATPLFDDDEVGRVVVAGRDVTDLKLAQQRLRRQRDDLEAELDHVFERIDDGFFALDADLRFTYLNERAEAVLADGEDVVGEHIWDELEPGPKAKAAFEEALATQEQVTFEEFYEPFGSWFENQVYPSETGISVYFRDISDRKAFEETLTALYDSARELLAAGDRQAVTEVVVDTVTDVMDLQGVAAYLHDPERDVLYPAVTDLEAGFMREELPAVPPDDSSLTGHVYTTGEAQRLGDIADSPYLQTNATEMRAGVFAPLGEHGVLVVGSRERGAFDERTLRLLKLLAANAEAAYDRVERERELGESEHRYRTLVDNFPNGAVALFDEDLQYLTAGGELFDGLDFSAGDIEGDSVGDWFPDEFVDELEPRYRAVFDGETSEFELEFEEQVRQVRAVPIRDDEGEVFVGMAMSQDITERIERERELVLQREQLGALNNLNDTVNEITTAAIERSTREEIEAAVCERLAATDSYTFAWIGGVDAATQEVSVRAEAGVEGYLDDITISADPDDPDSQGATGQALVTGEMQTTQDISTEATYDRWRDHVEAHRFRSSAAAPITHEGTTYGVLNVYADRPHAFEGEEGDVLERLGTVVGHAIAAAERKRALMSDDLVEVEYRLGNLFERLGVDATGRGRITLDHAVPLGDDEFLVYGTATEAAVAGVDALVETLPNWDSVTYHSETGDCEFEVRLSEPPVLYAVASLGGAVERVVVEEGDCRMCIHLPPGVAVRRVTRAVREAYPGAELVRREQVSRPNDTAEQVSRLLTTTLTDRQRAALEAAYHAGFFAWPREATGREVADSLDIAPATFSQHLRKAERKVLDALLGAPAAPLD